MTYNCPQCDELGLNCAKYTIFRNIVCHNTQNYLFLRDRIRHISEAYVLLSQFDKSKELRLAVRVADNKEAYGL